MHSEPDHLGDDLHLEMALGEKIAELRVEFKGETAGLRSELVSGSAALRSEISLLRADTIKWIGTAIACLFKLFAK